MVDFAIPCATFRRLAGVALQHGEQDRDNRDWLRCVRMEIHKSHMIAVASYGLVLVAEKIKTDEFMTEGETVCITVEPEMLAFVERGALNDDVLIITPAPGWTVARLASGAIYTKDAEHPGADKWPAWRDLIPADLPNKTSHALAFSGAEIARMSAAAPSGAFVCQKHVNVDRPILVNDVLDPHWIGLFLGRNESNDQPYEPARIPDWMR